MTGFRKAYVPRPGLLGSGVTRPENIEAAVLAITTRWNASIPRHRVRVLTTARYMAVRASLAIFSVDEITAAIEHYAKSDWNLKKGIWKTFDHFFDEAALVCKIEAAIEVAEKAAHRKPPASRKVRDLQGQVARKMTIVSENEKLRRQYESFDQGEKDRLLEQARTELIGLGRRRMALTHGPLRSHVIHVIMRRQKKEDR